MPDFSSTWPWYVAGPIIGLFVPALLLLGNKLFGISSNFRHLCAASFPGRADYFRYDWKGGGLWNLVFLGGMLVGGVLAALVLAGSGDVAISAATRQDLAALGVRDFSGLVPNDLLGWEALFSLKGLVAMIAGGFLVGFGTAYAGGCTSGHGITGLASFELPSLIAIIGFFLGGLAGTYLLLPLLF
jgi:uncharacterized protein